MITLLGHISVGGTVWTRCSAGDSRRFPAINLKSVRSDFLGPCVSQVNRRLHHSTPAPQRQRFSPEKPPHGPRHVRVCLCCPSLSLTWTAGLVFLCHKGAMWHAVQNSLLHASSYKYRPDLPPLHHTPLAGACLHSTLLPTHGLIFW